MKGFVLLATQRNPTEDEPATVAIYEVGTFASVLQLLGLSDGAIKVLVEGGQRAKIVKYTYTDCSGYYEAEAAVIVDTMGEQVEAESLSSPSHRRVREVREAEQEVGARSGRHSPQIESR
jgi:ATP-dependent Lon protease